MVFRRFVVLLLLALATRLPVFGVASDSFPGVDDKWHRYESPNFELFSHVSDAESRQFLRRLELLRAVFGEMVRAQEQRPNLVTVYCFGDVRSFLSYTPIALRSEERTAAFYLSGIDRSVIVVSPVRDDEQAQRVIFHEYVHHLSRVNGSDSALWYTEGIAEFLSTISEDRGFLSLGLPIEDHVVSLRKSRLMPLDVLFSVDHSSANYNEAERVGVFYAESWAMFHYWYCGRNKLTPEERVGRDRFFSLVRNETEHGNPETRKHAFEAFAKMSYKEMALTLQEYVRTGRYISNRFASPQIPSIDSYAVAAVPVPEMRRRLAELDLRVNRSPRGKLAMLEAANQEPADSRAHEILAADAMEHGDTDVAHEHWKQAIDAGSKNPTVFHELAALESAQWFSRLDFDFELPPAKADKLRDLTQRSIETAPSQTQAYEILAWVEATVRKPSPKSINLVQKQLPKLRSRARTLLALALVRVRLGDYPTAQMMLQQVDTEAESETALDWSRQIRGLIERRTIVSAAAPAAN
jgi:hypothetical protein